MKTLLIALVLVSSPAYAKSIILTGAKAQGMMESLAGAGFDVKNIGEEWGTLKEPISIATGPFYCHFNALFPDGWMANATCFKGLVDNRGNELNNPLALAQAIKPYAAEEDGLGNRWISVDDIRCALKYNQHQ